MCLYSRHIPEWGHAHKDSGLLVGHITPICDPQQVLMSCFVWFCIHMLLFMYCSPVIGVLPNCVVSPVPYLVLDYFVY